MPSTDLRGRRVLLTGATGLLGGEVLAQLGAAGAEVVALTRQATGLVGCREIAADLTGDFSARLATAGTVDAVIHLAQGPGWRTPTEEQARGIEAVAHTATLRLAEFACRSSAAAFVFASTGGLYAPAAGPVSETSPLREERDMTVYFAAKRRAELALGLHAGRLKVFILRYFFIYGAGQKADFPLMAGLRERIAAGNTVTLAQGRGARHNPVHVADAARATIAALSAADSATINIAGPEAADIRTICDIIATRAGVAPVYQETSAAVIDLLADISEMKRVLAAPKIGLADGIHRSFR
jgi:nucleoside-diphosphate-sugar epimerase